MISRSDLFVWTGRDGQEWSLATRRDRRLADGWVDCGAACDGDGKRSPDCVDGLVPNPQQVEAAARDAYDALPDGTQTFNDTDWERAIRAGLVAAAKTEDT